MTPALFPPRPKRIRWASAGRAVGQTDKHLVSRPPSLRHPCLGRYACGIRRSQARRGAGEDQLFPHSQRSAPVETYRACNTNTV
jgi:hypothetical protein